MKRRRVLGWAWVILMAPAWPSGAADLPPGVMAVDGQPAPALRLNSIDGASYDLTRARGHWVFVHFWASWCGPCKREMPAIQRMTSRLQDRRLEIVMVNTAETEDQVFTFLAAVAPDVVPLMDTQGQVTEQWQPRGLPATFLVDPQGRIQYQALGGRAWDTPPYVDFLRRLVAGAAAQSSQSSR
jgi:thiol-disulfide isomerase/thioredoxin